MVEELMQAEVKRRFKDQLFEQFARVGGALANGHRIERSFQRREEALGQGVDTPMSWRAACAALAGQPRCARSSIPLARSLRRDPVPGGAGEDATLVTAYSSSMIPDLG